MAERDVNRVVDGVWRIESARLIAALARISGDVGVAEDLAQQALLEALEQWPESGIPENPGAWLTTTAKRRWIDRVRRSEVQRRKAEVIGHDLEIRQEHAQPDPAAEADDVFEDDLLRLLFTTCHPVLSIEARMALTLRLFGGLTTKEIARAYLTPEPTIAARITRAKRTLAEARVPIEVPGPDEIGARLSDVLEVIYLIFNEGYSPTAGNGWTRPELIDESLRLGRVLAELVPQEREAHGLVALMELQASRSRARLDALGEPVLLLDQDRSRWDWMLVGRGLAALERAQELGGPLGPYTLQAAIAACHGRARRAEDTDWEQIAALYDALAALVPSPVIDLNRAVAHGMAFGPEEGLALADALVADGRLDGYHLLPAVRADLLAKLGRNAEARAEFDRAASMTRNEREQSLLRSRAEELRGG